MTDMERINNELTKSLRYFLLKDKDSAELLKEIKVLDIYNENLRAENFELREKISGLKRNIDMLQHYSKKYQETSMRCAILRDENDKLRKLNRVTAEHLRKARKRVKELSKNESKSKNNC